MIVESVCLSLFSTGSIKQEHVFLQKLPNTLSFNDLSLIILPFPKLCFNYLHNLSNATCPVQQAMKSSKAKLALLHIVLLSLICSSFQVTMRKKPGQISSQSAYWFQCQHGFCPAKYPYILTMKLHFVSVFLFFPEVMLNLGALLCTSSQHCFPLLIQFILRQ